ncbi:hypothetical protein H9P43_000341 [Blastocladiella emersonii ATCC 22665]|nr:hypothetical protein H9P43_000341 [Blastocladiella emersonii ATCC 22665]
MTTKRPRSRLLVVGALAVAVALLALAASPVQAQGGNSPAPAAPAGNGTANASPKPAVDDNTDAPKPRKNGTDVDVAEATDKLSGGDLKNLPPAVGIPYATLAMVNKTMYIIGGMDNPVANTGARKKVFAMDLAGKVSAMDLNAVALPDMSTGFGNGCAVVKSNAIYIAGGQFESTKDQLSPPWFVYEPLNGNKWQQEKSPAVVPWFHATCTPGSEGQFMLISGGLDTADGSTLTSSVFPFTNEGVRPARDTLLPPALGSSFIPFNATHMFWAGGVGTVDAISAAARIKTRHYVEIATGRRSDAKEMLSFRQLFQTFLFKNRYVIHLGGTEASKKANEGELIEWYDTASNAWPAASPISNKDKGPTAIFAPTAFMHDDHIFLVGGLIREAKDVDTAKVGSKYLRILKVEEINNNGLNFTWVDSYAPKVDTEVRGPLGLSVWTWVAIGGGAAFALAMLFSGIATFRSRMTARKEEKRIAKQAAADYHTRVEYENAGPGKKSTSVQQAAAAAAAAGTGSTIVYAHTTGTSSAAGGTGGVYGGGNIQTQYTGGGYGGAPGPIQPQYTGASYYQQQQQAPSPYVQPQYTGYSDAYGGSSVSGGGGYYQQQPQQPQAGYYGQPEKPNGGGGYYQAQSGGGGNGGGYYQGGR